MLEEGLAVSSLPRVTFVVTHDPDKSKPECASCRRTSRFCRGVRVLDGWIDTVLSPPAEGGAAAAESSGAVGRGGVSAGPTGLQDGGTDPGSHS